MRRCSIDNHKSSINNQKSPLVSRSRPPRSRRYLPALGSSSGFFDDDFDAGVDGAFAAFGVLCGGMLAVTNADATTTPPLSLAWSRTIGAPADDKVVIKPPFAFESVPMMTVGRPFGPPITNSPH